MPDSNLVDDGVLTSTFYNTYIREQVVVTCTSGTRPSAVEGRLIYETDTDLLRVYNGSTWAQIAYATENRVVVGDVTAVTFNGSGVGTLTFGVTFSSAPILVCTLQPGATGTQRSLSITSKTTTNAVLVHTSNDAVTSGTISVNWLAFGPLA